MQFRFTKYNEKTDTNTLLGYTDIKDYDVAFKMFTFMKEHECELCVEINTKDIVDTEGDYYYVQNVYFVSPQPGGELLGYITVELND